MSWSRSIKGKKNNNDLQYSISANDGKNGNNDEDNNVLVEIIIIKVKLIISAKDGIARNNDEDNYDHV